MRVFGSLLRAFSYIFHLILALFFLAISVVALLAGQHNLSLRMLPWRGEGLTLWLLGLSLFAILAVVLAVSGRVRLLFTLWTVVVLILMVRGFFLTNYHFSGPSGARDAVLLTAGALAAFFGSLMSTGSKAKSWR